MFDKDFCKDTYKNKFELLKNFRVEFSAFANIRHKSSRSKDEK